MSKITEFYAKAVADESAKTKLAEILGGKDISEATDEQLEKVGELAKKLGFEISLDDAKAYLNPKDGALDDDALDAVAGGNAVAGGKEKVIGEDPFNPKPHPLKCCECAAGNVEPGTIKGGF